MISRRIWLLELPKTYCLSVTMARSSPARKTAKMPHNLQKAGGGAWGNSTALVLPTEGGCSHRKVTLKGTGFWPAPRKVSSAGATDAGDASHLLQGSHLLLVEHDLIRKPVSTLHWRGPSGRDHALALRDRHRDEPRRAASANPH